MRARRTILRAGLTALMVSGCGQEAALQPYKLLNLSKSKYASGQTASVVAVYRLTEDLSTSEADSTGADYSDDDTEISYTVVAEGARVITGATADFRFYEDENCTTSATTPKKGAYACTGTGKPYNINEGPIPPLVIEVNAGRFSLTAKSQHSEDAFEVEAQ